MAYNSKQLMTIPSSSGVGGFMTYVTQDDTLTQVKAPGFITSQFARDFIRLNGVADGGNHRLPILIRASDGIEWGEMYLDTANNDRVTFNTNAAHIIT